VTPIDLAIRNLRAENNSSVSFRGTGQLFVTATWLIQVSEALPKWIAGARGLDAQQLTCLSLLASWSHVRELDGMKLSCDYCSQMQLPTLQQPETVSQVARWKTGSWQNCFVEGGGFFLIIGNGLCWHLLRETCCVIWPKTVMLRPWGQNFGLTSASRI